MSYTSADCDKVHETNDIDEVNTALQKGWILLQTSEIKTVYEDGSTVVYYKYLVGHLRVTPKSQ